MRGVPPGLWLENVCEYLVALQLFSLLAIFSGLLKSLAWVLRALRFAILVGAIYDLVFGFHLLPLPLHSMSVAVCVSTAILFACWLSFRRRLRTMTKSQVIAAEGDPTTAIYVNLIKVGRLVQDPKPTSSQPAEVLVRALGAALTREGSKRLTGKLSEEQKKHCADVEESLAGLTYDLKMPSADGTARVVAYVNAGLKAVAEARFGDFPVYTGRVISQRANVASDWAKFIAVTLLPLAVFAPLILWRVVAEQQRSLLIVAGFLWVSLRVIRRIDPQALEDLRGLFPWGKKE